MSSEVICLTMRQRNPSQVRFETVTIALYRLIYDTMNVTELVLFEHFIRFINVIHFPV